MKRIFEMMVLVPAAGFALPILVDSALKGVVLMALVLAAVLALRKSSAALRHLVLLAAMVGLLVLPLLSLTLPAWQVLPAWAQTRPSLSPAGSPAPITASGGTVGSDFATLVVTAAPATGLQTVVATEEMETPWIVLAVWLWVAGSALLGLWLALSQWALWRLGRTAEPARDARQLELLEELKSALQVRRPVKLLLHAGRAMPMTWGIFKTSLLLPAESLAWAENRTRAVLLHELAHVKRRDCLTQLLVQAVCTVHWFNPLVWLAARRLAAERELACDDLVIDSGIRASDYAEHLLRIATGYGERPIAGTTALAMARKSRLEDRLASILSRRTNRSRITRRVAFAVVCCLAMLALPVAMMRAVADERGEKTIEELAAEWAEENLADGDSIPEPAPSVDRDVPGYFTKKYAPGTDPVDLLYGRHRTEFKPLSLDDGNTLPRMIIGSTFNGAENLQDFKYRDAAPFKKIESQPLRQHTVKRGDSFAKIAKQYGVTPEQIFAVNEVAVISAGSVLLIPSPDSLSADTEQRRSARFSNEVGDAGALAIEKRMGFPPLEDEVNLTLDAELQEAAELALSKIQSGYTQAGEILVDPWGDSYRVLYGAQSGDGDDAAQADAYLKKYSDDDEISASAREVKRLRGVHRENVSAGLSHKHPAMIEVAIKIAAQQAYIIARGKLIDSRGAGTLREERLLELQADLELLRASGLGEVHPKVVALEQKIVAQNAVLDPAISGIGIMLRKGDEGFVVMDLLDGGPAAKSRKIKAGDHLKAFAEGDDGEFVPTDDLDIEALVEQLRGKAGSTVRLMIHRSKDGNHWTIEEVAIVRELLKIEPPQFADPQVQELEGAGAPVLLQLQRIDAVEAKEAIDDLLNKTKRGRLVADADTNSLIYIGDAETLELVRKVLQWLDVPEKE